MPIFSETPRQIQRKIAWEEWQKFADYAADNSLAGFSVDRCALRRVADSQISARGGIAGGEMGAATGSVAANARVP